MQQTSQERQETQLEQLLMRFAKQNESLSQVSNALQGIGHRLEDTNYPQVEPEGKAQAIKDYSEGWLNAFNLQLNSMANEIQALDNTANKLNTRI
jgi:predicted  nucleic acid-binding Zn-ribbon protein